MIRVTVRVKDIAKRMGGRNDFYTYMTTASKFQSPISNNLCQHLLVGYYLPHRSCCTLDFMLRVFSGDKRAFKKSEVVVPVVRELRELSPSNLLNAIGEHQLLYKYLPDKKGKTFRVDRDYIRTIIAKLEPEFWEGVCKKAHDIRHE